MNDIATTIYAIRIREHEGAPDLTFAEAVTKLLPPADGYSVGRLIVTAVYKGGEEYVVSRRGEQQTLRREPGEAVFGLAAEVRGIEKQYRGREQGVSYDPAQVTTGGSGFKPVKWMQVQINCAQIGIQLAEAANAMLPLLNLPTSE